jgi:hypothetical protein
MNDVEQDTTRLKANCPVARRRAENISAQSAPFPGPTVASHAATDSASNRPRDW